MQAREIKHIYFDQEVPYEEDWLNILVDTRAGGDENIYFKWDFEETWEFEMPEYIEVWHGPEGPPPTMEIVDVEWERIHCWVSEPSSSILTTSTVNDLDNEIKGFILHVSLCWLFIYLKIHNIQIKSENPATNELTQRFCISFSDI